MDKRVKETIGSIRGELIDLSNYIYENPELGFEEYKASRRHIDLLKKHNFKVEEAYLGFDTAFKASYDSGRPGPTIAYLAEYDALPGIGHGCGHNILGAASTGAALGLSKLMDQLGGRVYLLGSPAEETSGVKVDMADQGVFKDVDVAMMAHPSSKHRRSGSSRALLPLEFVFKGRTAHAASDPENGINALDACIQTFNNINALREHLLASSRIHGIIKEGGQAANIVPDRAVAQFYLRTPEKDYMDTLEARVIDCAKAGALAAGADLSWTYFEKPYKAMLTNEALADIYEGHIRSQGIGDIDPNREPGGSLDMGNVSQVCPSIHPYFPITTRKDIAGHSLEFAQATITEEAYKGMEEAIYALIMTGVDLIEDGELLRAVKEEFRQKK